MKMLRTCTIIVCCTALAGCSSIGLRRQISNYAANTPEIRQSDVARFSSNQNAILKEFSNMAGVDLPGPTGEWRPVIDAGIHYADVRCDRFMDSLFWFNRVRETSSRQIQYTGAAVSAAMTVVGATANAIGLTPLGFNFLDQSINNLGSGLLFNINPSNVRTIVERRQLAFRQGLSSSYNSRSLALQIIQDYASICLPPSIETEVENAISTQQYAPQLIAPQLPPVAGDISPDPFGFTDSANVSLSTAVESGWQTLRGTGSTTSISISGTGEYQIRVNGVEQAYRSDASTIPPNAMFRVRLTSSSTVSTPISATLTIGDRSSTFTVTTVATSAAASPAPAQSEPTVVTPEQNSVPNVQPIS